MRSTNPGHFRLVAAIRCAVLILMIATPALAQKEAGTNASVELAKKLQNPVASLISVPFQNNFEWGLGQRSRGFKYTLNFQPVIPISITEHWNLISRTIVPVIHQDDVVADSTQGGLGDITQSLFFSPKEPEEPFGIVWGVGPVFLIPTSTEDYLGSARARPTMKGAAMSKTRFMVAGVLLLSLAAAPVRAAQAGDGKRPGPTSRFSSIRSVRIARPWWPRT